MRLYFLMKSLIAVLCAPAIAWGQPADIRIGNTSAYTGPAAAFAAVPRTEAAFFRMVNDQGGVAGHRIDFISYDDAYSPPKAVEMVRKLVEDDKVSFLFSGLGTATNAAVQKYLNTRKVPQLFVATGADRWGDYQHFPWTMGYQPSYRTEARILMKYMLREVPEVRLAILYQNDDFGKDFLAGAAEILGDRYARIVAAQASYETTDPTIDGQLLALQASGANVLLVAATAKFAALAIKRVHDLDWHPMFLLTGVSSSAASVIGPAGPQNAIGIITTGYMKDPADPAFADDPGLNEWRAFMARYMPGADLREGAYVFAYGVSKVMLQVLRQCEGDFSQEMIMKQAANLHGVENPVLLPGITVSTSPTNYHPVQALQLERWDGSTWVRFGGVIDGTDPSP